MTVSDSQWVRDCECDCLSLTLSYWTNVTELFNSFSVKWPVTDIIGLGSDWVDWGGVPVSLTVTSTLGSWITFSHYWHHYWVTHWLPSVCSVTVTHRNESSHLVKSGSHYQHDSIDCDCCRFCRLCIELRLVRMEKIEITWQNCNA